MSRSALGIDFEQPLALGELVDLALQNHPATREAWWNANRAAAALGSAKSSYYPKLDLETFVTHGREFKFLNGPNTNYTILGANVLLSMMLYDFGETSANVCAAKHALIAANWQSEGSIQKVMINVLENAYALIHAQEVLAATQFSLEDAERMMNQAMELNHSGITPISDVYIAKTRYAQLKMELSEKKSKVSIHRGKLAASLGMSADQDIQVAPVMPSPLLRTQKTDALITLANQQRADLMAKRASLEEALARESAVRSSYRPKLNLSAWGGANHAVHDKTNAGQYEVTVGLSYPLFTGFEAMYQKRMALADAQLSRESLAQLELDIALEVLTQSRSVEAAQEMMPDAEEALKNSLKAYESMFEIYRAGKERMSALSDVQRQLAAARIHFSEVKTQWLTSIARLAYATGTLVPYTSCNMEGL